MASSNQPTGAQRVAAFLMTLDKESATEVIKHLDENVIVEVVEAIASHEQDHSESSAQTELHKELIRSLKRPVGVRVRSEGELHDLLKSILGPVQADKVFDKIHQRLLQERPFISIEKEPAANIAIALGEESDAVASLVLAHVDPALSAQVLGCMDEERALGLVRRMAALVPPGFDTLIAIAQKLSERLAEIGLGPVVGEVSTRLKSIAELLGFSEPRVERSVLGGLEEEDAQMVAEIREYMFTWEDLASLDKRAMQKVLTSVDTRTLSISLKGSSPAVEENILSNLSSRVREMVADERELAGPMPMSEVQVLRDEVMKAVRGLMESGEIKTTRAGEDLVT